MRVHHETLIDAIRELIAMRRQVPVIHFATRREPVFASLPPVVTPPTPHVDTPAKVAEQPCQARKHQSPSHFEIRDFDAQTDYPVCMVYPDPMLFRNDPEPPQPTPPNRPRKRSARTEKAAKWIRHEVRKNGNIPPFKLIVNKTKLPKATASRLRREIMIEMMAA
jgi:hypothetical protein